MKFSINGYNYEAKVSTFPGGEEYLSLPKTLPRSPVQIKVFADIRSSKEVMQLLLLTDALHRVSDPRAYFSLVIPYLPYARQDRVCAKGESFSLKVFAKLINDLNYEEVLVTDCHSEIGLALLDNVRHITQVQAIADDVGSFNLLSNCDVVVAPDLGAAKKAKAVAEFFGKPVVQCLKTRHKDGKVSIEVLGNILNKNAVVVDDICDGGATFLALAEELGQVRSLNLHVTHGIFSKGKEELLKHYDYVGACYDWTS